MVALLSDIEVWVLVTAIPVAPTAAFTCSGLSSNPASSRSTRGRGIIDRVVVGDSALPIVLAHPAIRTQAATASAAVGWRMCSFPFQPCRTDQRGAMFPHNAAREHLWCGNAADTYVHLNGVSW